MWALFGGWVSAGGGGEEVEEGVETCIGTHTRAFFLRGKGDEGVREEAAVDEAPDGNFVVVKERLKEGEEEGWVVRLCVCVGVGVCVGMGREREREGFFWWVMLDFVFFAGECGRE